MKFPWNKKDNKKEIKDNDNSKINDNEEIINKNLVNSNLQNNEIHDKDEQRKLRFANKLYSFSSLPDSAKETLNLLTKSDQLIKLYSEKLDIINFSRKSLGESLKNNLKSIKELNLPD